MCTRVDPRESAYSYLVKQGVPVLVVVLIEERPRLRRRREDLIYTVGVAFLCRERNKAGFVY